MEEIVFAVIRELPSTAVLIFLVYHWNTQVKAVLDMAANLLQDVIKLMENCLKKE